METRWRDDIATVATDVYACAERLDSVFDVGPRVGEEELDPTAPGELLHGLWQGRVGVLDLDAAGIAAFVRIFIEDDQA